MFNLYKQKQKSYLHFYSRCLEHVQYVSRQLNVRLLKRFLGPKQNIRDFVKTWVLTFINQAMAIK